MDLESIQHSFSPDTSEARKPGSPSQSRPRLVEVPEPPNISEMLTEDLTSVLAIERRCFLNPWGLDGLVGEMMNPRAIRLVGRLPETGEVVGFGLGCIAGPELHINKVATHPDKRRAGVGRLLVGELLRRGCAQGASEAWLELRCSNRAAAELYRSLGFRRAGIRVGYYSRDGEDAHIMSCSL